MVVNAAGRGENLQARHLPGLVQLFRPLGRLVDLSQRSDGRRIEHASVGQELRSVAGAVPALLEPVPMDDASDMRAGRTALGDRPVFGAIDGVPEAATKNRAWPGLIWSMLSTSPLLRYSPRLATTGPALYIFAQWSARSWACARGRTGEQTATCRCDRAR